MKKTVSGRVLGFVGKYPIYFVLLIMVIVMSILSDVFFTPVNITNILVSEAGRGVLALAVGLVIITGGMDLSIASIAACASVIATSLV